jgi:hypothetical protein
MGCKIRLFGVSRKHMQALTVCDTPHTNVGVNPAFFAQVFRRFEKPHGCQEQRARKANTRKGGIY